MDTALADPLIGTVLDGRYRVEGLIARGGMSSVYAGLDLRLGRRVAVKVMAPGLAHDPVFVRRFGQEARAAALLSHPNAVAVHDQGTSLSPAGDIVFLVMELVPGRTLRDLVTERGRLGPDEALSLVEPVLAALAAAHRAGLVHRDVKPENVLISSDGVVKVADFGLARAVAAPTTTTQAGVVLGTVAYVAPEQVTAGTADPRTDVYAAGIVLFELLTGAPPYGGDSAVAVAYRHVHDDVPPPSAIVASVPPAVDELVLRATRREPGGRPADAGAFLAELIHARTDAGLRRVPVPVHRAGPPVATIRPGPSGPEPATVPSHRRGQVPRATTALPVGAAPVRPGRPGRLGVGPRGGPRVGPAAGPGGGGPGAGWPDERRAHRRRFLVGLICVLLLGAGAAAAGWWYGSGRMVEVPPLTGISQRDAVAAAKAASLQVRIGRPESSERVRAGLVLRTDPGAGDRVLRGTTITLVTSSGRPPVPVPGLVGRTQEEAETALREAGLRVGASTAAFSAEVAAGRVIRHDPPAGRPVARGSRVALVVSKGPDLVRVPEVVGESLADARRELEQRGFRVAEALIFGGQLGRVVYQSPRPGRTRPRGSTVTVRVF